MAAYDDAALQYLDRGLWPIPVMGKDMPVKGATGYEGTVTREKVAAWLQEDVVARARAGRGNPMSNIALRHDGTIAVDVDHGYGDKDGVTQLIAFAEKHGLPPLAPTWSSTARGPESPSRQYVYRVEHNVKMRTKPCKAVEVCCSHHRYTVCAPSIHPGTGNPYTWYLPGEAGVPPTWGPATAELPHRDSFTMVQPEWLKVFTGGLVNADRSVETVDLPELCATFPTGPPDGLIRFLIRKWTEADHVGHDDIKNQLINAVILGREGHPGVPELVELLITRFTAYVRDERPTRADVEIPSTIAAAVAIGQQKPITPLPSGARATAAFLAAGRNR